MIFYFMISYYVFIIIIDLYDETQGLAIKIANFHFWILLKMNINIHTFSYGFEIRKLIKRKMMQRLKNLYL
jgi:hypothetical protein